ncbi:MAG: hypothetical protein ACK5EU_18890 [Pseudanabaena sp.]|jgi:hypothetical protein|nr:hypothetical protein [Pseudanabaena sp. M53BS1SP1A06MG]MCA6582065.1 hypothetical protein [Pseudanabaena sp. M34BS1SP1A06MG]MCA6587173.1 hypothetical protein [Pseudanabaena sp. M051S1SP1A06QC]MCA6590147.1 hypothetical protein [Pseudanabaena sp. M109S1SP1A06QC]MCA6592174.1 hypothetical protein [Pseudanabaena sp. M38BS1SP1A06MG]MCA6596389.1 hypothetical protein [Pseudanabaena sp. M046S1SP1A06QC]MCA6602578.1 hypothetical protein [Pseudanabaena sp. M57BS1SP1A06MG]MCA6605882.1 hypothetical prot
MPKFQIYIAIVAITLIVTSCQQSPSPSPTSAPTANPASEKAINYLRSQLKLSANLAIMAESAKSQSVNIADLCQTVAPTQEGFEIVLVAEDTRYILQTNQDASKIEICRSEDAQPATTGKYNGAGYTLRYPAEWKVIDIGLESSGASTVIFTPSKEVNLVKESNLEQIIQKLQQSQQVYAIVVRQPSNAKVIADGSENAKDVVTIPFEAKVKGAKSGSKKEFTTMIASSTWKVQALTLEADKFFYTVRYYQPVAKSDANSSTAKAFAQFANSFALVSQ